MKAEPARVGNVSFVPETEQRTAPRTLVVSRAATTRCWEAGFERLCLLSRQRGQSPNATWEEKNRAIAGLSGHL